MCQRNSQCNNRMLTAFLYQLWPVLMTLYTINNYNKCIITVNHETPKGFRF